MAAYEVYDLSGGWYEYLLVLIERHCERTRAFMLIEKDDNKKRELEAIACDDEKLLSDLKQYIRKDMTIKLFPSQTHRIVWVLLETCIIFDDDMEITEKEEHKEKNQLTHLLSFCNKIVSAVIDFANLKTENESKIEQEEESAPTEVDTL